VKIAGSVGLGERLRKILALLVTAVVDAVPVPLTVDVAVHWRVDVQRTTRPCRNNFNRFKVLFLLLIRNAVILRMGRTFVLDVVFLWEIWLMKFGGRI
jgi:hypothetical protein